MRDTKHEYTGLWDEDILALHVSRNGFEGLPVSSHEELVDRLNSRPKKPRAPLEVPSFKNRVQNMENRDDPKKGLSNAAKQSKLIHAWFGEMAPEEFRRLCVRILTIRDIDE
ncbi:hypothetical protein OV208_28945 [Corallococcus sp. bb12-1]|uniref:hypothetical protein n=1 Tax=Corallococcus sp. bb12-1 TaxID=2996784 RepID=UPI002270FA17|nr:hypothetical protein [Corallococcus sp. bb12-1]MCY1045378.1 hypothetical protein [Corallococcus sp. bb12-1]